MHLLQLVCKSCGARFESGVPLQREHLEGVKLRTLEICPDCGVAADYRNEDYMEPGAASGAPLPRDAGSPGSGPGPAAAG